MLNELIFFPQNKLNKLPWLRQRFNVKIETEQVLDYFNRSEDKQGFVKYYLEIPLLYYVLTDIICQTITYKKYENTVILTLDDQLMPEWTFTMDTWKAILKEYCVYLDEQQKHIYGRQDVLKKLQSLFEAYGMFMKIQFKQTTPQLTNDDVPF